MTTPQPDYSSLRPLAAVIENAIQNTPIRLGTNDWGTALGSQLLADISVFMGKTLGPDAPILAEIQAERERQDARWGEQNHPDVDPRDIPVVTHRYYASRADIWRQVNEERATASKTVGRCWGHPEEPHAHTAWDGVLLEEVYEALAEEDPAALRAELVQVAAVAAAWIAAIDRRTTAPVV